MLMSLLSMAVTSFKVAGERRFLSLRRFGTSVNSPSVSFLGEKILILISVSEM